MDVRVGVWRKLSTELMPLNCGFGEDSWVPWTARRPNQSILKEISLEYSLEGLMLKLKLQYFGHPMWRTDSLEKTLMLAKSEGRRRRGWQEDKMVGWHRRLNGHEFEQTPGDGEGQESLVWCSLWGCKELDMTEWTTRNSSSQISKNRHVYWPQHIWKLVQKRWV